jgi:CheY-like chemotaxis protein
MRPADSRAKTAVSERPDPNALLEQAALLSDALAAEQTARAQAEDADRAKSDLLALVSHELRTPMGAVIAMAELLLAGKLEDSQRRYAETLHRSARSLLGILNDILDYSKLEAGRFELDEAPIDLREFVQSIGTSLEARVKDKSVETGVSVDPGCPDVVLADAARLRQILMNLLDNGLKFTSEGSVRLQVGPTRDGAISFEVADTGIGLDEHEMARLFQPYVQIDRKIASQYGGTGLGLSIARRLADLMGGEIVCESDPGLGSRFRLVLPLSAVMEEAAGDETGSVEDEPRYCSALSGRILVVEDNAVNRMLIGAYLDEFGVDYDMASSGEEALDLLTAKPFHLVLMDIMMPGLDGIEATKRIRSLPGMRGSVPIVALTANAMKGDRESYLAAGMNAYVSKPIRGRELYDQISAFLGPAQEESSGAMVR